MGGARGGTWGKNSVRKDEKEGGTILGCKEAKVVCCGVGVSSLSPFCK